MTIRTYLSDDTLLRIGPYPVEGGKTLNLTAVPAPTAKAAAEYYPALYWFSLMHVPPKSDFPGTGPTGNGIAPNIRSQGEWIRQVVNTDGCTGCHQLGNPATREIPKTLGMFESSAAAWDRRIQSGQAGGSMSARFTQVANERGISFVLAASFPGDRTFERRLNTDKVQNGWAEFCNTWTNAWPHTEQPFRSNGFVLSQLTQSRALGVNYLLGVGPMSTGEFCDDIYKNMSAVADWMKTNGESIHGTKPLSGGESATVPAVASDGTPVHD